MVVVEVLWYMLKCPHIKGIFDSQNFDRHKGSLSPKTRQLLILNMTKDCLVWVICQPTLSAVAVIAPNHFTFFIVTPSFSSIHF